MYHLLFLETDLLFLCISLCYVIVLQIVIEQNFHVFCAAEAPLITGADDMDLEEEFSLLEAELDKNSVTEIDNLPEAAHRDRLPVHEKSAQSDASSASELKPERSIEVTTKTEEYQKEDESAESLERAFAKLELELA